jgi:protein-S-isoprenylcysteine O-methyltransferase Ste14
MNMRVRLLRLGLFMAAFTAVLTWMAGGLDRYLALYCAAWTAFGLYGMVSIDDDLARERFNPPEPGADRQSLRAIRAIALLHLVIGALDAGRWHLGPVAAPLRVIGLAGMLAGSLLIVHAMRVNRFFSAVVRVQSERGHRVVDAGPYATVRHPGYIGMLVAVQSSSLALGSWLGFALAAVYGALIVRRVCFEDAFLKANLAGYQAYASRVSSRLIPGAW